MLSELRSRKSGGTTLRSLSCFSQERCPAERGNTSAMECPQSFHPEHHAAYPDLPSSNRAEEASHTWLYTEWWRKDLFGPLVLKLAHQEHRTHLLFAVTQSWCYHTSTWCTFKHIQAVGFSHCTWRWLWSQGWWEEATLHTVSVWIILGQTHRDAGIGLHILKPRRFWL